MVRIFKGSVIIFGFILISSSGLCEQIPEPAVFSLSLDEAIGVAFKNNKVIQIQSKETEAARAAIMGARSEFLPRLDANAGYTRNSNVLSLGSSPDDKKDKAIYTGYMNDNKAGISASQTIYNGGANIAGLTQAKLNLKIQEQTLRIRKQNIAFETKRLYYGLLLAYEMQKIAGNLIDLAQSHYEDAQKKYEAGVVSRFDVLQSKVQVSKLRPELIKADNAVDSIAAELKKVLGLKMDDVLSLKDALVYAPITVDEKEFLITALLTSPEVVLSSLGIDAGKVSIEIAKSTDRPQVSAGAAVNFRSSDIGDMINRRHETWNAGFSVAVPIFDGFSSRAKVDEAKVRYAQALLSKENLIDQIAVNVKEAILDLRKSQALIDSQRENIEEAREALRISQVRYDNGEGTNLDVLEAQVSLSQVEKYYSDGIYDYLMAGAFLNKIIGGDVRDAVAPKDAGVKK